MALGFGWVNNAWIDAGWVTEAWEAGESFDLVFDDDAFDANAFSLLVLAATNIDVTKQTLVLTEQPVDIAINIDLNFDALTLAEFNPQIDQNIQPTFDALTLTEYPVTVDIIIDSPLSFDGNAFAWGPQDSEPSFATTSFSISENVDITTAAPEALTLTEYTLTVFDAFDNEAFDEAGAFDQRSFSIAVSSGTVVSVAPQALTLTTYPVALGELNILVNPGPALTLTTYPVSFLDEGEIRIKRKDLIVTEYKVSIIFGSEIIPATRQLVVTTYKPSVSVSIEGTTPHLVLTEYPVLVNATHIDVTHQTLSLVPQQVTIEFAPEFINVGVGTDLLTVTPYGVSINATNLVTVGRDILTLTPAPVDVRFLIEVDCTAEAFTLTTYPVTVGFDWHADLTTEAFTLTEYPVRVTGFWFVEEPEEPRAWTEEGAAPDGWTEDAPTTNTWTKEA
jgi:hypothetical protein